MFAMLSATQAAVAAGAAGAAVLDVFYGIVGVHLRLFFLGSPRFHKFYTSTKNTVLKKINERAQSPRILPGPTLPSQAYAVRNKTYTYCLKNTKNGYYNEIGPILNLKSPRVE